MAVERMRDSEFASNIPTSWPTPRVVAGYYGGGEAANMWTVDNWKRFKRHRKLPIWVAGSNGQKDGIVAVESLRFLKVPKGVYTAVDMEARVDDTYVTRFGQVVQAAGYKVWVYGSADTVFGNPRLDGYWVADYANRGPFMYNHRHVRATQYADPAHGSGGPWDSSTVRAWSYHLGSWWK